MRMAHDPEKQLPAEEREELASELEDDGPEALVSDPERPPCPRCGWHNTRLSHTKTIIDSMLKAFSFRAFRCRSCGNRFRIIRRPPKT